MSTNFFTNRDENTLINKFKGVFENNPTISCFDAVVGYFRASGYFQIRPFLNQMSKIRILVGINADQFIAEAQQKGLLYLGNSEQTKDDFLNTLKSDIHESEYSKVVEEGILQFIDDIISAKIEVRAHPSKKIHAKVYILYPENFNQHTLNAAAITGSSNLSGNGLGIGNDRQYEFNVLLHDNTDVKFALEEFQMLWDEAKDCNILPTDLQKVKADTYLAGDITPYELYLKMLIEYFGDDISNRMDNPYELPEGFKKMEYQLDAVEDGFRKLIKYDGFFLSDVVGLGKTVVATMIAKRFLIENGVHNSKILVVYPPAVEKNWITTFTRFGIDQFTKFVSNGSLNKVLDPDDYNYWNADEFDLILVDESHKFRNHETRIFKELQEICKCPRINTGYIEGRKKKVMLISATPLNNSPLDLYHQILLFQNPRQSTLSGVPNLTAFFAPKVAAYKKLKSEKQLNVNELKKLYEEIREKVIKPITVRRTRTDIEGIERYKNDVGAFPKVEKPCKIEYELNDNLANLFNHTVSQLTDKDNGLKYARYQAIAGLKPEIQNMYYDRAELVSKSLSFIMKTFMVKRLESSFDAFKKSLNHFKQSNQRMIEMFNNDKVFIAPDLDLNVFYDKGLTDEEIEYKIIEASEENPKNQIFSTNDFDPNFLSDLYADQVILEALVNQWDAIKEDPKLIKFLENLDSKFFDKKLNPGQKLVVFSESKDTVDYLHQNLKRKDVLTISASNRNKMFQTIEDNFDANIDEKKQKNDFNIIITTEVLAEGVNLHRSNVIINYDTPWNSTRLMQRIGRVNRIGSTASSIYNFVFYPSAHGNAHINLVNNSLAKIQAFHTAFGEDNQIYSTDEIVDLNLEKLFQEGLPKEEKNRELEYLEEIRRLKTTNPKEFRRIEKLNLRCRCGRNSILVNDRKLANETLVFLKTNQVKCFYLISDKASEQLSALQAIDYFKADKEEPRVNRIEQHHEHVKKAQQNFEAEVQAAYSQHSSVIAAGQQVNTALSLVRRLKPTIEDSNLLLKVEQLMKIIEWGTITSLAVELNRMDKKLIKKQISIEECYKYIIEMANKYHSYFVEESTTHKIETPCIILSESFNK